MSEIYPRSDNGPQEPVTCSNCNWTGTVEQCQLLQSIEERISAGEYMPAGECPECGSCAHLTDEGIALQQGKTLYTDAQIAAVFWDYLPRDPENKDRRQTGYGTKTQQGLAATIRRLGWTP